MDGFLSIYQLNSEWITHPFTETQAQLKTDPKVQRNCYSGTSQPITYRIYLALLFLFVIHYSHHGFYILHFHAWKKILRFSQNLCLILAFLLQNPRYTCTCPSCERYLSIYLSIDTASPSLLSIMRRDACERIKVKNLK